MVITSKSMLFKNSPIEMFHKKMVVYMMRYLGDGKIYVGKTTRELRIRIIEHIHTNRKNHIDNAIKKHGIGAFDIRILGECESEDELNKVEVLFIAIFDCKHPNGFNSTDGGEGVKGLKFTDIHRGKIAAKASLRKQTKLTRDRISISKQGQGKGKPINPNTKAALRASRIRPVICIETNRVFESIVDASKWAGVSHSSVGGVCRGKAHTAGGYHWSFIDKDGNLTTTPPPTVEKNNHRGRRKVLCKETGEVFKSVKAAADWAKVSTTSIRKVCNGRRHTSKGYHWVFVGEEDKAVFKGKRKAENRRKHKVICLETGKVFESIVAAAKWANTGSASLGNACSGKQNIAGGYHWAYYTEGMEIPPMREDRANRKVVCLETGKVFKTIDAAAKWAGIAPSGIGATCRGKQHTAGGYHWAYADEDDNIVRPKKHAKRGVLCKETGKIFESLVAASKWAGVASSAIGAVCLGKLNTAGGYHWEYAEEKDDGDKI